MFISHLEPLTQPDQASSTFFSRAATVFSRTLDEVLETRFTAPVPDRDIEQNLNVNSDDPFLLDLEVMQLFENTDLRASFDQMLC